MEKNAKDSYEATLERYFGEYHNVIAQKKLKEKEYLNSIGYKMNGQLELFAKTWSIYQGNYNALNEKFEEFYDLKTGLKLWSPSGESIQEYLKELSRHLHNYLASATTLIEHTRILNRRLFRDNPFLDEYQTKIEQEFALDPLSNFIKKFRNYFLHLQLAPIRAHSEIRNRDFLVDITVIKEKLLEVHNWGEKGKKFWNEPSLEFINRIEVEASLRPIIQRYAKKVNEFYLWYQKRFHEIFAADFSETNKIRNQILDLERDAEIERGRAIGRWQSENGQNKNCEG